MRNRKIVFTALLLSFTGINSFAQSVNAPLNEDYYHLIERFEIQHRQFAPAFHATVKPYTRQSIVQLLDSVDQSKLSKQDQFNWRYLKNDNWDYASEHDSSFLREKAVFKALYKRDADFARVHQEGFSIQVNPVLSLALGQEEGMDNQLFTNTRGVEIRGMIDDKIGFYTFLGENQLLFPTYVRNFRSTNRVLPQEGFFKPFKDQGAVDFFTARGYISFQVTKSINLQFGHDRFFLGNGFRSTMLSDHTANYLFLKAQTKVWKLNYTNLFAQMTADNRTTSSGQMLGSGTSYPQKFMASHHLSYNIGKNFNIGIFETVIFGEAGSNSFDLNYLNPIIFYRAIEHQDGSSGNALVGTDFRWLLFGKLSLYGQLVLDEFKLNEIRAREGWWANKWATQIGMKYINAFGIKNLDLQVEHNLARPYMYTHQDLYTSYTNYRQALAHPLGANFKEQVAVLRWQPVNRLSITATAVMAQFGTDSAGSNWGQNVLKPYTDREQEYGNVTGQGVANNLRFLDLQLSYMAFHNLFIDLRLVQRNQSVDLPDADKNATFAMLGLRLNIPKRNNIF